MKRGSMFQKTRIRLTILNSLVFIILIGVLGSIIYVYTYNRIYSGVDNSIEMFKEKVIKDTRGIQREFAFNKNLRIGDPRITVFVWNEKQKLIEMKPRFPEPNFYEEHGSKFFPKKFKDFQDIEINGKSFRTWAIQRDIKSEK